MAGEGAMMQAIKSLAYNKSLRGNRNRTSWKEYKNQSQIPGNDPIKSTPEQLEAIRVRIQAENKKSKQQQIVFILLMLLIFIATLYYIN
jgi:hypothetical protein